MVKQYIVEQLNHGRKVYDFMYWSTLSFILLGILLIASIIIMIIRGFNWGIDFTGGTVVEITLEKSIDIDILRESLSKLGFIKPQIQNFGSSRDIIVRFSSKEENISQQLDCKIIPIIKQLSGNGIILKRIEFVGPSISNDLALSGVIALLVSLISILIYVSFRFEWRLALGSVLALIYDVIIVLGNLSLFHVEINLVVIASLMSVIGYSLNDSIVVFDRIRENFSKIHLGTSYEIVNVSLTQILNRTIITSVTTLMVILLLFIFGGVLLNGFSITMLIGVSIGTISSIYIASALALKLGIKRKHILRQKLKKEKVDQFSTLV